MDSQLSYLCLAFVRLIFFFEATRCVLHFIGISALGCVVVAIRRFLQLLLAYIT